MSATASNPFTDAHWEAEIKALGLKPSSKRQEGKIAVDWFTINGRCDDYLNVNMRFSNVKVPALCISGALWMSLTPMEVQSAALAIQRAKGTVVVGGLGLGYTALRMAAKPNVTTVTVYEIEPDVIAWFNKAFAGRSEMAKIKVIVGDVRKLFCGIKCDFAYMDIYQSQCEGSELDDMCHFIKTNTIGQYHFWGYERAFLAVAHAGAMPAIGLRMSSDLREYISTWASTPYNDKDSSTLDQFHKNTLDSAYATKAARVLLKNGSL